MAACTVTALLVTSAGPASAAESDERHVEAFKGKQNVGVPAAIYDGIIASPLDDFDAFNSYEWVASSGKLRVHYSGDDATLRGALTAALPQSSFELVRDAYSVADLEAEAWRLASSGKTINGMPIASAGPLPDGSGIKVSVEGSPLARSSVVPPADLSPFPLQVAVEDRPEVASRQYDGEAPHWGGAVMSTPAAEAGKVNLCTTGFGVGYMSGTDIVSSMITADHCGTTGSQWRTGNYSDSPILGTMQNTSAVGTDIKRLAGAPFGPVIYGGPWNSNSGIGIKGAIPPILNDYWCYSGAPSGQVCNNKVTQLNMTTCYSVTQCYRNQVYSEQMDGIPAVGQGDSGGPAIAPRNGSAYAVGIISGIRNAGTVCNANMDGRLCSKYVIAAPVEGFFQDNPNYGILIY